AMAPATHREGLCLFSSGIRHTCNSRHACACPSRTYLVDGYWTYRVRLRTFFLPRRSDCDSHQGQSAGTSVRTCAYRTRRLFSSTIIAANQETVARASGCRFVSLMDKYSRMNKMP